MTEVAATGQPVVDTHGLRKTFESEGAPVRACGASTHDGTRRVRRGHGTVGCGKSTLLNIVAGLDTPHDGEVSLAGEALVGRSEDELAIMRGVTIGIVFQFFNTAGGHERARERDSPAVIAGAPRKRPRRVRVTCSTSLGLADKAKDAPGVLSGGQRQRLRSRVPSPTNRRCSSPTKRRCPRLRRRPRGAGSSSADCRRRPDDPHGHPRRRRAAAADRICSGSRRAHRRPSRGGCGGGRVHGLIASDAQTRRAAESHESGPDARELRPAPPVAQRRGADRAGCVRRPRWCSRSSRGAPHRVVAGPVRAREPLRRRRDRLRVTRPRRNSQRSLLSLPASRWSPSCTS